MTAALSLLAVFLAAPLDPPTAERDTDKRVRELIQKLSDMDGFRDSRRAAAEKLEEIGPAGRAATAALLRALHDPGVGVSAARALLKVDPDNKEAIPALVRDLHSRDQDVRLNACSVLGAFGGKAHPAVPALVRALRDPDYRVWVTATYSLASVDPTGPATAAALGALLLDWQPRHLSLVGSLEKKLLTTFLAGDFDALGPTAQMYLDDLKYLRSAVQTERLWAADILAKLGPAGRPALPALRLAADDGDPIVRRAAVEALKKVEDQGTRR